MKCATATELIKVWLLVHVAYVYVFAIYIIAIMSRIMYGRVHTHVYSHVIRYGHFDILQDEEVRQGLKEFSKWPTYPQVRVLVCVCIHIYLFWLGFMGI